MIRDSHVKNFGDGKTTKNFPKKFEIFLGKIHENNLEKNLQKILNDNMNINFDNHLQDIRDKRIENCF